MSFKKLLEKIAEQIVIFLVVIALLAMCVGFWYLGKRLNYKMAYKGMIKEEIAPLNSKIKELEKRIRALEANCAKRNK